MPKASVSDNAHLDLCRVLVRPIAARSDGVSMEAVIRSRFEQEGCSNITEVLIIRQGALATLNTSVAFVKFEKPWYAQAALMLDGSTWPEISGDSTISISTAMIPKRVGPQPEATRTPTTPAAPPARAWPKSMVLKRAEEARHRQNMCKDDQQHAEQTDTRRAHQMVIDSSKGDPQASKTCKGTQQHIEQTDNQRAHQMDIDSRYVAVPCGKVPEGGKGKHDKGNDPRIRPNGFLMHGPVGGKGKHSKGTQQHIEQTDNQRAHQMAIDSDEWLRRSDDYIKQLSSSASRAPSSAGQHNIEGAELSGSSRHQAASMASGSIEGIESIEQLSSSASRASMAPSSASRAPTSTLMDEQTANAVQTFGQQIDQQIEQLANRPDLPVPPDMGVDELLKRGDDLIAMTRGGATAWSPEGLDEMI